MSGYSTPEAAPPGDDSVPAEFSRVVAVEYSPSLGWAVVFIACNEPTDIEAYVVLCEQTADSWVGSHGGSASGSFWVATSDDGSVGVRMEWDERSVEWRTATREGCPRPDKRKCTGGRS